MNSYIEIFSQLPYTHHAYGIESTRSVYAELSQMLPVENFSYIIHKQCENFTINDARAIKSLQIEKTEKSSLFVLECMFINHEAQNALLKVLEEPASGTYFILVFPSIKKLLPTLQSRLEMVTNPRVTVQAEHDGRLQAADFITKNLQEKLIFIKDITNKKDPILKSEVLVFLDALELIIKDSDEIDRQSLYHSIYNARAYMHARGASTKMILDMIAIELSHE